MRREKSVNRILYLRVILYLLCLLFSVIITVVNIITTIAIVNTRGVSPPRVAAGSGERPDTAHPEALNGSTKWNPHGGFRGLGFRLRKHPKNGTPKN